MQGRKLVSSVESVERTSQRLTAGTIITVFVRVRVLYVRSYSVRTYGRCTFTCTGTRVGRYVESMQVERPAQVSWLARIRDRTKVIRVRPLRVVPVRVHE